MGRFRGKAPGAGAGEMSARTSVLRPSIGLTEKQVSLARAMRRRGTEPADIAAALGAALEEVERALLQMRSPRPETTRGTLNVTLAAHRLVMTERRGDEPIWQTVDRMIDELLSLRAWARAKEESGDHRPPQPRRRHAAPSESQPALPGFSGAAA